jgi:hypothetical protein
MKTQWGQRFFALEAEWNFNHLAVMGMAPDEIQQKFTSVTN